MLSEEYVIAKSRCQEAREDSAMRAFLADLADTRPKPRDAMYVATAWLCAPLINGLLVQTFPSFPVWNGIGL
jgi:hypothetical protein